MQPVESLKEKQADFSQYERREIMHEQFGYCLKAYSDRLTLTIVSKPEEDHTGRSDGETEILYAASFCLEETTLMLNAIYMGILICGLP